MSSNIDWGSWTILALKFFTVEMLTFAKVAFRLFPHFRTMPQININLSSTPKYR